MPRIRQRCIGHAQGRITHVTRPGGGTAGMDVTYVPVGEALVVAPVGRVDEATWEEFGAHLAEGIGHAAIEGRKIMVIDLSGVEYMSSRGLRALTMAKQEGIASGVSIRLAAPND